MSKDYGDMDYEYGSTPYVASSNRNRAPVDSQGERYTNTGKSFDFVYRNEESYNELVGDYKQAWISYFEIETHDENGQEIPFSMPAYSEENAQKLQDVIRFALYMDSEEEVNVELTNDGEPIRGHGVWSEGEKIRNDSPRFSPYAGQDGSYENPETFYNQELYDEVTDNGQDPIPTLEMDGDRIILTNTELSERPHLAEVWSSDYREGTEYESVRRGPKTPWEWGGPYATGKRSHKG